MGSLFFTPWPALVRQSARWPGQRACRVDGRSLRGIDGFAKQIARSTNALRIRSILEFDAFDFQEVAEAFEQLILFDRFHNLVQAAAVRL